MTTAGTVTASVPAGVAADAQFSTNTASTSSDNTVNWQPDTTAPTAAPTLAPAANAAGWHNADVIVTWNWADEAGGSGLDTATCPASSTSNGEGAAVEVSATCNDLAGNQGSDSVELKIDKTKPTLAPTVMPDPVILGGVVTANPNAADTLSGVASSSCTTGSTATIGTRAYSCTATDVAGNQDSAGGTFTVAAFFGGFTAPLPQSLPAKAGSTIPVRFTLTDADGSLSGSVAAGLASNRQVRVALIPPLGGSPVASALCSWDAPNATFACNLKTPKRLLTGPANMYALDVQQKGTTGSFFSTPGPGNPLDLYFR
jgi:hypothetical protein